MLRIDEVRELLRAIPSDAAEAQLGPFVLIQRPQHLEDLDRALRVGVGPTDKIALHATLPPELVRQFDALQVTTLPPLREEDELSLGRLPDNDVVVNDASVSKHHALLRWNASRRRCVLVDLESRNGTLLNGSRVLAREELLADGDLIQMGEAVFVYFETGAFRSRLDAPPLQLRGAAQTASG
ncbi:MAG: FHA domain-containing protein [Myxococcaceae bacterium]